MKRFIIRRLMALIPVLFIVSFMSFSLIYLVPGDPAAAVLGDNISDQALYDQLREEMGLDRPFVVQYITWLGNVLTGNLGSTVSGQPLTEQLIQALGPTVQLAIMTMLVAVGLGIPTGILAALRPGSRLDLILSFGAIAGFSAPGFLIGILLLYLLAVVWPLFPSGGYVPFSEDPLESVRGMILPALALGIGLSAVLMRQMRSSMINTMRQDYIRVARAMGLRGYKIVIEHALKNSLIPVLTIIGLQLGVVFGGVAVTETIFSIPGIGRLAVDSIFTRNYQLLQIVIMFTAMVVMLGNVVADLLYAIADPRIRYD